MCENKPGPRCAADTVAVADRTARTYIEAHPGGPDINPLAPGAISAQRPRQDVLHDRFHASSNSEGKGRLAASAAAAADLTPRDLTHQIKDKHPGVSTWLYRSSAGHVVVSNITVDDGQRGQGRGEAALNDITQAADRHGWTLSLTPDGGPGSSKKRLTTWYTRHGFKPNKGRNRDFEISEAMFRLPKEPARV